MKIRVDNKGFSFGDHRFTYYLYYFEGKEWDAATSADSFKKVLLKWADILEKYTVDRQTVFLPFAPDDHGIECLRTSCWFDKDISFSWVDVQEAGYSVDFSKMDEFCIASHVLQRESPEFGWCKDSEFIFALRNAEIIDDPTTDEN